MKQIIEQIPVSQLNQIIVAGKMKLIDVRDPQGIEKQGSIPTTHNVPLGSLDVLLVQRHMNPGSIFNNEDTYLFCCTGGVMSYMAALKAQEAGLTKVYNLEGGHSAWKELQKN